MLNYIHADLHRIFRRISRCVFILLVYAAVIGNELYQAVTKEYNSINLVAGASTVFETIAIILGLVEIQNVFADDFRAKTMQIAIGLGVSRPKVVLVKLIDFAVLTFADCLVMTVLFILGSTACGIPFGGDQIYLLVVSAIGNVVYVTIAAAFTMIPIFYLQTATLAVLIYLVISVDPISILLTLFRNNEVIMNLHLTEMPYSVVTNTLATQLALRNAVPIPQLIGVVAYLAIAYGLTVLGFNKRELEF